jgi:hypothetical protein
VGGESHSLRRVPAATVAAVCALGISLVLPAIAPAASVDYDDFSSTDGLQLNLYAQALDDVLRLTTSTAEVGTAFTNRRVVKPNRSFTSRFTIHQHDGTAEPADGMAFVVQSKSSSRTGGAGSGLGYGDIGQSLAVEFDIFDSGGEPGGANHVAITKNGQADDHLDAADPGFGLYGSVVHARVTYSAKRHRVKVWVNDGPSLKGSPLVQAKVNLAKVLDDGGFAGFTAATGGFTAVQDVLEWHLKSG